MLLLIRAVYAEQFFTISPVYGPSHQRELSDRVFRKEESKVPIRFEDTFFFTLDKYVEHMSSWHRKKNPNSIGNVVGMGDESKSGYR